MKMKHFEMIEWLMNVVIKEQIECIIFRGRANWTQGKSQTEKREMEWKKCMRREYEAFAKDKERKNWRDREGRRGGRHKVKEGLKDIDYCM